VRRKVFHPRPAVVVTGREDVDLWNEQYEKQYLAGIDDVRQGEVWTILEEAGILTGRVLEAGCGDGAWIKALREMGINVHGLDFSVIGLRSLVQEYPGTPVVLADVRRLPYQDGSFDVILSWGVLEHLLDGPEATLKEAFRCLRRGGMRCTPLTGQ